MKRSLKRRGWSVSASQVEAFNLCQRKWAFRAQEEYKQNIGAFRGEAVWKILQRWGKRGTPPENSLDRLVAALEKRYTEELSEKGIGPREYAMRIVELANKMTDLFPRPPWPRKHKVEERFRILIDGVPWSGAIDMHGPGYVRDNKVVAAAEYALLKERDPEKPKHLERELLRENVQALLYAFRKLLREPANRVTLEWVYGQPGKRPRAWVVRDEVSAEYVENRVAEINETGRKIVRLGLLRPDPLSLPANWDACHKYGGCPFQEKCQPTVEDIASTVFPTEEIGETMGILSDIKGKKASTNKGRKVEDEDDGEDEQDEDDEVEAPKGKAKRGEKGAGKVDKETMRDKAQDDIVQLLDMKVKAKQIVESIIAKYKFLTEDEITEIIEECSPKKSKGRKVEEEDESDDEDEQEETPKAKKATGKVTKISDETLAVRAMVATALRAAADALDD